MGTNGEAASSARIAPCQTLPYITSLRTVLIGLTRQMMCEYKLINAKSDNR